MNLFNTVNKEMSSISTQFQTLVLAPVMRGFNKTRYDIDTKALQTLVLKFSANEQVILEELDSQFIEDEIKFIRLVSQWQNKIQGNLDFMFSIFGKSSLPEELKDNELKFWRAYIQVIGKKDAAEINKENVSLTIQDNAVLFAYFLNKIFVSIVNKKIKLLPPIRMYYAVKLGTIVSTTYTNDEAGRKAYAREIQIMADQSFVYQLAIKVPEKIADFLDFHLRSFIRNGGNQADWVSHTKQIWPAGFTPEQKDSFFTWIERHDQSFKQWFEYAYNLGIFKNLYKDMGKSNLKSMLEFEFSNLGNFSKPITKDTFNEFYNYLKDNEQNVIDKHEQDRQEMTKTTGKEKISGPVIRLFCAIVHQCGIMEKAFDEGAESYIERVCMEYDIKVNPQKARQYFTTEADIKKTDKNLTKVKELILPNIASDTQQKINSYIDSKTKMYV